MDILEETSHSCSMGAPTPAPQPMSSVTPSSHTGKAKILSRGVELEMAFFLAFQDLTSRESYFFRILLLHPVHRLHLGDNSFP